MWFPLADYTSVTEDLDTNCIIKRIGGGKLMFLYTQISAAKEKCNSQQINSEQNHSDVRISSYYVAE